MNRRHQLERAAVFPLFAGIACAGLGLTVLVGWYTHNLALIHVLPAFVGMAYNTALGFLFGGVSLAASAGRRPRLTLPAIVFAALVGLPTLAEYVTGRSFGLDQMLMSAYTRAGVTQAGRMAAAAALCFTLLGFAFACVSAGRQGRHAGRYSLTAGLLGALIAGLGVIALSGYVAGITTSYTWGQLTRMAVHTAGGFVLMGLGIVSLAWAGESRAAAERRGLARPEAGALRLPTVLAGVGAATVSLCLWQALIVHERAQTALVVDLAHRAGLGPAGLPKPEEMLTSSVLGGGLLLSALLAGAVSLVQTARRQSAALQQARDEMEERVQARTEELAAANQALRDVLLSVTDGKLRLCDTAEQLPAPFSPCRELIPLTRQDIQTFRHRVRQAARDARLTLDRSSDLETAVGEAGMNAAVHGSEGTGEVYTDAGGTVQVWVTDRGGGIDMVHLPRATLERGYTTAGTLGHGFWLMLNTVDRVWLLTGPAGTTVVLEQDCAAPAPAWLRSVINSQG